MNTENMITFFLPLSYYRTLSLYLSLKKQLYPGEYGYMLSCQELHTRLIHSHSLWTANYEVLVFQTHQWLSGAYYPAHSHEISMDKPIKYKIGHKEHSDYTHDTFIGSHLC